MLKQITLAALVAIGGATLTGVAAQPAAADSFRGSIHFHNGHDHGGVYHRHGDRRRFHVRRFGPGHRFLRRVRHGSIVCYRTRPWRGGYRADRRGHRFYRAYGRRLGYRAVRRLARRGHYRAMRCFRRF
ncbi:MAG TPA: hypothetical protein VLN73_00620 [Alphaproteobacteria bacterium]|nr:hypothetical protein [Alphaproteobacteria bacterium]